MVCLKFKILKFKKFGYFLKPQNCVEHVYIASIRVSLLLFCSSSCMEDGEAEIVADTVGKVDEKKEDVVVV